MRNKSSNEFFSNVLKNNYCRYANTDLNDYINNVAEEKEVPRVRCKHLDKNGKQCITILNSHTINSGFSFCNVHNTLEVSEDYSIKDSKWKCNATVSYEASNGQWTSVVCNEPSEERTVVGDNVFYRCPRHSFEPSASADAEEKQ